MKVKREPQILKRGVAAFIDYGLYFIFFIWLVTTYGTPNDAGGYTLKNDIKIWWIPIVWFLYFPIAESISGQTLGKLILGLRVVTKTGNPITFVEAFKRHLLDMIDLSFFGLVGLITVKNSSDHQRVGDLFANTIVIGETSFTCTNCKDSLTLSADEIVNREFVCPNCSTVVKL